MFQFALDDIAENFRVPVGMLAKAPSRFHHIVIDDAQRTESHVVGIKIIAKGKGMTAMEPAQFSHAARFRWTFDNVWSYQFSFHISWCLFV